MSHLRFTAKSAGVFGRRHHSKWHHAVEHHTTRDRLIMKLDLHMNRNSDFPTNGDRGELVPM